MSFRIVIVFVFLGLPKFLWAGLEATVDPNEKKQVREENQVLDESWREYLRLFGGSTPFEAINTSRSKRFHVQKEHVQNVLKGNTKIDLHETFFYNSEKITKVDLSSFSEALRLEAHDQLDLQMIDPGLEKKQLLAETSRFRDMREHMQQIIYNRDEDELIILFAGEMHALDLFFSSFLIPDKRTDEPFRRLEEEVYYVAFPIDGNTPFYTPDYLRFVQTMRGTRESSKGLKDNDLIIYTGFLARLAYYNGLRLGLVAEDEVYSRDPKRLGTLVIMDWHDARLPQMFDRLPGPASVKRAGFKKVTFAIEGVKFGENYSSQSLPEFYTADLNRYLKDDEEKAYYKRFRKKAYALLEKGFVSRPLKYALHQKILQYKKGGLNVRLTGLENYNRFGFKKAVETSEPKLVDGSDEP